MEKLLQEMESIKELKDGDDIAHFGDWFDRASEMFDETPEENTMARLTLNMIIALLSGLSGGSDDEETRDQIAAITYALLESPEMFHPKIVELTKYVITLGE